MESSKGRLVNAVTKKKCLHVWLEPLICVWSDKLEDFVKAKSRPMSAGGVRYRTKLAARGGKHYSQSPHTKV